VKVSDEHRLRKYFRITSKCRSPPPKKNKKEKQTSKKTTGLFGPWLYKLWYMLLNLRNQNVLIYTLKTFLTVNVCLIDRPCYARKKYICQLRSVILVVYFYYISYTVLIFIHIQGHLDLNGIQNTYSVIVQRELLKVVNVSAFQSEIRKKTHIKYTKNFKITI